MADAADPEVERIRAALHHREHDGEAPPGSSAVLAPIVPTPAGLLFLLERRPAGRSFFAGQLSFPGGRIESDDASPLAAALRETQEEVGLRPDDVRILGHLDDAIDPFGRRVSCFVGVVEVSAIPTQPESPNEVEELLLVPLDELREPLKPPPERAWPPGTYSVLGYESRTLPSARRILQYWPLGRKERKATLWGFTAGLVALFLHRVYGWAPPGPPRVVERWDELQP